MTADVLKSMLNEQAEHKRVKSELTKLFIEARLNKCIESYYKDLRSSYESLKNKNTVQVFKKLNKG